MTGARLPSDATDASGAPADDGPVERSSDGESAGGATRDAVSPDFLRSPIELDGWPLAALIVELGAEAGARGDADDGSGRVVAENRAATALLGTRRPSDGPRAAEALVVEADRAAWRAALHALDMPASPLALRAQGADGALAVEVHLSRPRDLGPSRVLAVFVPARRGVEAERAVAAADARWRDVTHELQAVREAEQTRIARELHDQLGADLSLLRVELARIAPKLRWVRREVRETVERMRDRAGELLETVRRIARELRPRVLDHVGEVGLAAVLEYVVADVHRSSGVVVHLDAQVEEGVVDAARAETAYHVVREALHNVVRHAKATRAVVSARLEGDAALVVEVLDDGRGASAAAGDAVAGAAGAGPAVFAAEGIGWWSLRERVRAFGGEVAVRAEPGVGTTVSARIPLARPGAAR